MTVNHLVRGSSPRGAAPINPKKEKLIMATNTTNKELKEQVTSLRMRVNQLVDEIHTIKSELSKFKTDVSKDVTYLTTRVDS